MLVYSHTVSHIHRFYACKHRGSRISFSFRIIPVLFIPRQFQLNLPGLQFCLLKTKYIRIQFLKYIHKTFADNGAKAALGSFAATEAIEGLDTRSVWFDPVNSLVTGDKTEQDWIDGVKAASDQLRAALK